MHILKNESLISKIFPNFHSWVLAARPKTLTAGITPVFIGSALAFDQFNWLVFLACLMGTILIQIATNFINDASDFLKGADTKERIGPLRTAASGLLTPDQLYVAATICLVLTALIGIFLVSVGGLPILILGIVSIFFAYGYTSGPLPLAYFGLGDLFTFLFFGLAAVLGTYYLHTSTVNLIPIIFACATGMLGTAIIVVNNTRDIETDKKAQKQTISSYLGENRSKYYFATLIFIPYALILLICILTGHTWFLAAFLSIPAAIKLNQKVQKVKEPKNYNPLLGETAKLQFRFGILVSLASILWKI